MCAKKLIETIPEDLRILSDSYSLHSRASNRLWIIAATLTLLILSSNASDQDDIQIFGLSAQASLFFPSSVVILSLMNIAFCSAHMQSFFTTSLIEDRLKSINASNTYYSDKYTVADVVHSMYQPHLKRIFPLVRTAPKTIRYYVYIALRLLSDAVFIGMPLVGCIGALFRSSLGVFAFVALSAVILVTSMASFILLVESVKKICQYSQRLRIEEF